MREMCCNNLSPWSMSKWHPKEVCQLYRSTLLSIQKLQGPKNQQQKQHGQNDTKTSRTYHTQQTQHTSGATNTMQQRNQRTPTKHNNTLKELRRTTTEITQIKQTYAEITTNPQNKIHKKLTKTQIWKTWQRN